MNASANDPLLRTCVLTAIGRGAIATIALCGARASEVVGTFFRPNAGSNQLPIDRIRYGIWSREPDGEIGESIVVCATSETELEIHCHGGRAAVEAIVGDLVASGAERIRGEQWLQGRSDSYLSSECQVALAATQTSTTAGIVLDQIRGALATATQAAIEQLQSGNVQEPGQAIQDLIDRSSLGRGVRQPFRVVIAGPPNVGKSSLLNRLLGYDRAIAYDQPGTTRDVLSASTTLGGWTIELRDTAGIHETDEAIEREGVQSARREVQSADAVLVVVDASIGWTIQHDEIAKLVSDPIRVWNKADLIDPKAMLYSEERVFTSTVSQAGIDDLITALLQRLIPLPPTPGMAVPITERQIDCLHEARTAIASGDMASAIVPLQRLLQG
ncbi:tRNA modification GTPase MnmE [Rosistilla carotiformis]|uniref:tRNA modification GTPase MnmE n=1 Tax=Rosistilla carotiformis TaxID=2528017 RepID=A0A518JS26_9BACT|nr:GTPase [Rosistilla carotiformis]QDV68353.1 tRNA modification GTPase MnmE [Rosistilla carotiformis]